MRQTSKPVNLQCSHYHKAISYICNIPYIICICLPLESIRTLTSWIWEVSDGRPTWIRATGLRILSFSNGWKIQQGDLGVWARKSSFTRLSALRNKKSCNLPVKCLTSDQLRDDMIFLLSLCWYSDERSQGSESAWLKGLNGSKLQSDTALIQVNELTKRRSQGYQCRDPGLGLGSDRVSITQTYPNHNGIFIIRYPYTWSI